MLDGKRAAFEFEIAGLKGTHLWLDTHAVPLPGPQDGRPQMLAITRNITERKQAEAELRQLNEELEARVAARTAELEQARARLMMPTGRNQTSRCHEPRDPPR